MSPLAALPSFVSRPPSFNGSATAGRAADAQNTLVNRLAERLGLEPGALSGQRDDFTPEKVAGRVLGFIEQRLHSEAAAGADPAKLQGLLNQAREGVEKGFADARKVLDGMGVLQGKVATDIDDTYQRIQAGLGNLSERFGPVVRPDSGSSAAVVHRERFAAQAQSFDLSVTTRNGDRLRISIAQGSASWSQSRVAAASNASGTALVASSQSSSLQIGTWQVSVEGELDEEERAALGALFGQVQALSSKFYSGDLAGAFDRAMALEMDGEQLASMSLHLTQTRVRQASDAYSAVADEGGQVASAANGSLIDYARGLLDALRSADQVMEHGQDSLQALLKGGFALDERFDAARLEKAEQLNGRLLVGLQSLLDPVLREDNAPTAAA
ncbi:hypothetical protein FBY03_10566 [Pseudomonas sp. SJZ079]|uniref:DUF5610 domain-containing protein n=1 Tax=Pseudomonas sp. SJZ079 TaxID=2572887 RepID=UPI00119A2727|nr:DUF5610 domain-containing protein [Pseudomonas sp. SJZ079]TWC38940.1 hypothetical protein FBY03_10566 [Pseudomonas sp. SJZ079]